MLQDEPAIDIKGSETYTLVMVSLSGVLFSG